MPWNICHVVFVSRTLAIFIQNFNKQGFSFLLTHCYKIYEHSAKDMSVHQKLLQDKDTCCNNNFTSKKRLALARGSGKLFLGKFDGVWVLLEVNTMRWKVDIIYCRNITFIVTMPVAMLSARLQITWPPNMCLQISAAPQYRSHRIKIKAEYNITKYPIICRHLSLIRQRIL